MSLSRNIATYADVQRILTAALQSKGGVYKEENASAATRTRHRIHQYRRLLAEQAMKVVGAPTTPYDHFIFRQDGANIIIEARQISGKFYTPAGKELPLDRDSPPPVSDELKLAADLALETIKQEKKRSK